MSTLLSKTALPLAALHVMNSTSLPAEWARATRPDAGSSLRGTDALPAARGEWHLQRRCALSPAQLGLALGVVLVVSLVIAVGFWWAGAPLVTAFAGLELLLVATGFACHALHGADGERLHLTDARLTIDMRRGLRVERASLDVAWLQAHAVHGGAIELRAPGQCLRVGTHADAATNRRVLNELSQALTAVRRVGLASQ